MILLGTKGGPRVNKGRANPSNLVTAAGRSYVVDCGYGVTRQLVEAGIEAHEGQRQRDQFVHARRHVAQHQAFQNGHVVAQTRLMGR